MALCLTHPEHGYYTNRDPFGAAGDFTTAPEISQMFGELIGLWAAAAWRAMGSPENVRLVELGPGRGTMMLDALRTARVMPEFRAALVVHFVEISPALERVQRQAFVRTDVPVFWHGALADVPDGAADRPRQRVVRRAARAPGGDVRRRLARARGQDRRGRQAAFQHRPRSRFRCSTSCCRATCGRRRSARFSNGAPINWRWRSAGASCARTGPR